MTAPDPVATVAKTQRTGTPLAADDAKMRFLANMSHEIRTPLNAIVGLAHLMLEDELDPRQLQRLHHIVAASRHLLALVNDILDLAKIEAGQLRIDKIDFALSDTLDLVRNQIEERIANRPIDFRLVLAPDVPPLLHGDPLRFGQILLNFASNAAKFTHQGEIVLAAMRLSAPEDVVRLRFEMRDTGPGFDAEIGKRLFRPFEQGDASTTRQYGGSGLGLAICRELAEMMGGKIGADSTPGVGSTFWLELDFAPAQTPLSHRQGSAVLAGRRLLLVGAPSSDDAALAKLAEALKLHCYRCTSGKAAATRTRIAAANHTPYDFVLFHGGPGDADRLCDAETLRHLETLQPRVKRIFAARLADSAAPAAPGIRHRFDAILPLPTTASLFYETLAMLCEEDPTANAAGVAVSASLPPGRVLLVEDNPINREVAGDILMSAGIAYDVAQDGAEAVEKAQSADYDVILMDIQMPVMDGLVATRAIRAMERHAKTPIIAMTANAFEEDRRQCFAAGMDDYLVKPVTPNALKEKLRRWLPQPAADPPAPPPSPPLPDFRSIAGLDAEAGLRSVLGHEERYVRLLGKFFRHHRNDIVDLRAAFAAGDPARAHHIAHTLKGTAGVLGAQPLAEAARAADDLIRRDPADPGIAAALDRLEREHQALFGRLGPFERFGDD